MILEGKRILITGGTGSLGKVLVRRLLSGELGNLQKLIVFSRDEAKQHFMRLEYLQKKAATDEIIYQNAERVLEFRIGDVRDYANIAPSLHDVDVVVNAAALKQVPACEYFPYQAVMTNIGGPENIVRAIQELRLPVETVVGVSTDKAAKPVNVMGMTKAIQERIFQQGNLRCPDTRFVCVRYGNVLASRGSVIPFFHEQIKAGGPVTITASDMTRFLLSLNKAVDTIFAALKFGNRGETFIPRVASARVVDVAKVLIENRPVEIKITGIRPGEKMHEILVSEEEKSRTIEVDKYYAIQSILPEIQSRPGTLTTLKDEYSSKDDLMSFDELDKFLRNYKLMVSDTLSEDGETLR